MTSSAKNKTKKALRNTFIISTALATLAYIIYLKLSHYDEGVFPPLGKSLPFEKQKFDAAKGTIFHQSTGTHIVIPANALLDKDGNPVRGEVELNFREFQNAREIFQSGIPMQIGDEREKYFTSAGMMELTVKQNGEELKLKKDAAIDVELASAIQPDADFKLYFLTDDLNWDNGKGFETVPNSRRDSALANLPERPDKPINPVADSTDFVFELVSDYKRMPHLKTWKDVKWRLISSEKGLLPEDALRINWDKISIKQVDGSENVYAMDFKFFQTDYEGKVIEKSFSMKATPELTASELADAVLAYNMDLVNYELEFASIDKEEDRLRLEAGLLNKFKINSFGVYNIDKLKNAEILASVNLSFDFENELNPKINRVMLYVIDEKERTVFKFNAFDWNNIPITENDYSFVALLPNQTVAYVSIESFRAVINTSTLSPILENKFHFTTERFSYDKFDDLIQPKENTPRFI